MDYEHYILQGEAKSTEFSDDRSYLLVQKQTAIVLVSDRQRNAASKKMSESMILARYFIHVWVSVQGVKSSSSDLQSDQHVVGDARLT